MHAANTMHDLWLAAALERLKSQLREMLKEMDGCGGSGSPGEWLVEQIDEITTEQKRRRLARHPVDGLG
jgi:hypothetical protein